MGLTGLFGINIITEANPKNIAVPAADDNSVDAGFLALLSGIAAANTLPIEPHNIKGEIGAAEEPSLKSDTDAAGIKIETNGALLAGSLLESNLPDKESGVGIVSSDAGIVFDSNDLVRNNNDSEITLKEAGRDASIGLLLLDDKGGVRLSDAVILNDNPETQDINIEAKEASKGSVDIKPLETVLPEGRTNNLASSPLNLPVHPIHIDEKDMGSPADYKYEEAAPEEVKDASGSAHVNSMPLKDRLNVKKVLFAKDIVFEISDKETHTKPMKADDILEASEGFVLDDEIKGLDSNKERDFIRLLENNAEITADKIIADAKGISTKGQALGNTEIETQVVEKTLHGIKVIATDGGGRAKISLYPESLGHIRIDVTVNNDGVVNARMVADSPQVKEVIDNNLARLKNSLLQHGLKIDQFSVSVDQQRQSGFTAYEEKMFWQRNPEQEVQAGYNMRTIDLRLGTRDSRIANGNVDIFV